MLSISPHTALVVIDLQRGIVSMPIAPRDAQTVVRHSIQLIDAFRARGLPVVLVRVDFIGGDRLAPICDLPSPAGRAPEGWADLIDDLRVQPSDLLITKRQWGAFHGTELDLQLRRRGIDTIVLCGIATSIGVESTARDAYELGYHQIFAEDAMASRNEQEHYSTTINIFPRIGRVKSTADILAMLDSLS